MPAPSLHKTIQNKSKPSSINKHSPSLLSKQTDLTPHSNKTIASRKKVALQNALPKKNISSQKSISEKASFKLGKITQKNTPVFQKKKTPLKKNSDGASTVQPLSNPPSSMFEKEDSGRIITIQEISGYVCTPHVIATIATQRIQGNHALLAERGIADTSSHGTDTGLLAQSPGGDDAVALPDGQENAVSRAAEGCLPDTSTLPMPCMNPTGQHQTVPAIAAHGDVDALADGDAAPGDHPTVAAAAEEEEQEHIDEKTLLMKKLPLRLRFAEMLHNKFDCPAENTEESKKIFHSGLIPRDCIINT